jgi:hypothetical protein
MCTEQCELNVKLELEFSTKIVINFTFRLFSTSQFLCIQFVYIFFIFQVC